MPTNQRHRHSLGFCPGFCTGGSKRDQLFSREVRAQTQGACWRGMAIVGTRDAHPVSLGHCRPTRDIAAHLGIRQVTAQVAAKVGGASHRPDLRRISERQPPFPPRRPLRSSRTSISISWTAARRSAQQLQLLSTNWLCAQPLKRQKNCTRAADPRHCARPIMHSAASTEFSLNPSQDCMTFR